MIINKLISNSVSVSSEEFDAHLMTWFNTFPRHYAIKRSKKKNTYTKREMPEKWYALICNGVNKDRHIIYLNDIYINLDKDRQYPRPYTRLRAPCFSENIDYIFCCCALKLAAVAVGLLCSPRTLRVIHSSSMLFTYTLPGLINATHVCLSVAHWNISALLLSLDKRHFRADLDLIG